MSSKVDYFLGKTLGSDFVEVLQKTELWKPNTKTTLDIEDLRIGLKLVPRTIMALLIKELIPMNIGEHKDIQLPVQGGGVLKIDKAERDVYNGHIEQDNKKLVDFLYRSIPGVGLVIMSAFELYESEELQKESAPLEQDAESKLRHLIDERLALHDLIGKVVDKKLMEKEAVEQLILAKLTSAIQPTPVQAPLHEPRLPLPSPKRPLRAFLDGRSEKKAKPKEFDVHMIKGEDVNCQDCGQNLFKNEVFSGCVCLGEDMGKKIVIKKTEHGVKIRFGKSWDPENIEMLLETLRRHRG